MPEDVIGSNSIGVLRFRSIYHRRGVYVHAALVTPQLSQFAALIGKTVMFDFQELGVRLAETWPCWVVTITLVVAAVIDGLQLKVPNWITFPMIISGWDL